MEAVGRVVPPSVSGGDSLESPLRNKTTCSPVTITRGLFSFWYHGSETTRADSGPNDASSGILIVSPGLRLPFHDSSTRNTPSIFLPSVATTMSDAFQEQVSRLKEGLI